MNIKYKFLQKNVPKSPNYRGLVLMNVV